MTDKASGIIAISSTVIIKLPLLVWAGRKGGVLERVNQGIWFRGERSGRQEWQKVGENKIIFQGNINCQSEEGGYSVLVRWSKPKRTTLEDKRKLPTRCSRKWSNLQTPLDATPQRAAGQEHPVLRSGTTDAGDSYVTTDLSGTFTANGRNLLWSING